MRFVSAVAREVRWAAAALPAGHGVGEGAMCAEWRTHVDTVAPSPDLDAEAQKAFPGG